MTEPVTNKWFRRLTILLLIMAFWPVTFGAITTTLDAGMAFLDWPNSDGQNMITYPWLKDIGTDKFWEHGHRLGGMAIGILSIMLVGSSWFADRRRWIFAIAVAILLGVIFQGVLGGVRVLRDNVNWAVVHGSFAPLVTSLILIIVHVTGKKYLVKAPEQAPSAHVGKNLLLAYLTAGCLYVQYVLGCFLRHKGTAVYEHLGFAAISTALVIIAVVLGTRSNCRIIKGSAFHLFGMLLLQLIFGLGAWITRFGLPSIMDYMPRVESPEQNVMRTIHMVMGMLLFMSAVLHVVKVKRIAWLQKQNSPAQN